MRIFLSTTAKKISLIFFWTIFIISPVKAEEVKRDLHQQLMIEAQQFVANELNSGQSRLSSGVTTRIDMPLLTNGYAFKCPVPFNFQHRQTSLIKQM